MTKFQIGLLYMHIRNELVCVGRAFTILALNVSVLHCTELSVIVHTQDHQ